MIEDLSHLNPDFKLPIENEPGGIRLKIVKQKRELDALNQEQGENMMKIFEKHRVGQ
ncbi:MAG TPA: hypothetical protein VER35_03090 [Candidatus Limnocylindrales bacterium]|nr:hypothetical protein [Candidatus Limnocylindrales bacterium]